MVLALPAYVSRIHACPLGMCESLTVADVGIDGD